MVGRDSWRTWLARIVAPVAFFAAVTLLVLLVRGAIDDDDESGATTAVVTEAATTAAAETQPEPEGPRRFYRVRQGDTLESIASRFDTTVADLLTLNPDIDPLALPAGRRIRVR
jgi:LysM repeat protein